jgi:hypothetical protein
MTTTVGGPSRTCRDPIDEHLARLAARLPLLPGRRRDLLVEARDGLEDAAEAYRGAGLGAREAAQRAVADFGTVDELTAHYANQLVTGSARTAAFVLGVGYAIILCTWGLLGRLAPDGQPRGSAMAASSFTWIGVLSIGVTILVGVTLRGQARRSQRTRGPAWAMGLAGLGFATATLVASYLVQPWGAKAGTPHSSTALVTSVESASALITFAVLACSVHCLWSAWTAARA